jgi:hypothetical protein
VVRSSCYQKNIGAEFTHLYIPSLCKEFFVMRHNLGHFNVDVHTTYTKGQTKNKISLLANLNYPKMTEGSVKV